MMPNDRLKDKRIRQEYGARSPPEVGLPSGKLRECPPWPNLTVELLD